MRPAERLSGSGSRSARPGARIQSIGRAAALLDELSHGRWMQLGELAEATGLQRTTAFNLVAALADVGLVENDGRHGAYRLSLKHIAYGRAVERRLDIARLARPVLIQLCAETRETVNLAIPRPADVLIVESLEGSQSVRVTAYSGTRASYHSTACGRAIMAFRPEVEQGVISEAELLPAMTPKTVTGPAQLRQILADARRDGFVAEREENELGSCCVAAPILGPGQRAQGSISIAGPASRMDDAMIARLGALLVRVLQPLSQQLGAG